MNGGFDMGIPYYYQIKERLLAQLRSGEMALGDQIPPETELARQFAVSRETVRRAIGELVQEGFLERVRGRGTFVARPAVVSDARLVTTFAGEVEESGRRHTIRTCRIKTVPAVASIASELEIGEGERVFEITRVREGDGEPLVYEVAVLPVSVCPLLSSAADLKREGIYAALERLSGIKIGRASQTFQAMAAPKAVADALGIQRGDPVLLWQGVAYSTEGIPVEWARVYARGSRYRFTIEQASVYSGLDFHELQQGRPGIAPALRGR